MKPHKKAKLTGTSQKPYEAKQNAVREAETSTKYTKPHKTAKRAETSPKPNKTKQNAARAAETSSRDQAHACWEAVKRGVFGQVETLQPMQ